MAGLRGIQHVSVDVDDLDAALAFYIDRLGLHLIDRPSTLGVGGAWLSVDDRVQLHLVMSDHFVAPETGQHLAFAVDDVDGVVRELRAHDIEVTDPFDVGAGRQAFLRDPAGNLLELNQPT
ncbi:MAG TPA: VOC family protein [Microthrixaceae bacterium]|nr:VOC family protein [Microthrixaceae bacterium]